MLRFFKLCIRFFIKLKEELYMKELGNLAIICAKRNDLELSIKEGHVFVHMENSPTVMSAEWDNDEKISSIIFGKSAYTGRVNFF